jgi:hypothetical protein
MNSANSSVVTTPSFNKVMLVLLAFLRTASTKAETGLLAILQNA